MTAVNVVLDLDGTIVFPELAEIAIPGRSRPSYISSSTASLLEAVGANCNLYLATARNAVSVAQLVRTLPNVSFAGFVMECGLVWRANIDEPQREFAERERLCNALENQLPDWEHVAGYEQMICCIAPPPIENPTNRVMAIVKDVALTAA